jgi:ankyrin repeat protein
MSIAAIALMLLFIPLMAVVAYMALTSGSLHKAVVRGEVTRIKDMLGRNSGLVNARDNDGYTPLHYAVLHGHRDLVMLLLSRGADVNAQDNKGITPLHMAVDRVYKDIARSLITSGANVLARTKGGKTPLQYALERGHFDMANYLSRFCTR